MEAKDMFRQLNYYLDIETNNTQIIYSRDINDKDTFAYIDSEIIVFNKQDKNIYFTNKDFITYEELQAINQQMKEIQKNENT